MEINQDKIRRIADLSLEQGLKNDKTGKNEVLYPTFSDLTNVFHFAIRNLEDENVLTELWHELAIIAKCLIDSTDSELTKTPSFTKADKEKFHRNFTLKNLVFEIICFQKTIDKRVAEIKQAQGASNDKIH
ncbi:hypothetical protein [Lonepinella sp. MS14435]|uniref:hypothetical protein n=1 Tax=Lonepinella sp. MS14435 TaxID=3003618 RepID=UPI0036D91597